MEHEKRNTPQIHLKESHRPCVFLSKTHTLRTEKCPVQQISTIQVLRQDSSRIELTLFVLLPKENFRNLLARKD